MESKIEMTQIFIQAATQLIARVSDKEPNYGPSKKNQSKKHVKNQPEN